MALYFWTDSRYPALLKKLHSGSSVKVDGALSFDAKLPVSLLNVVVLAMAFTLFPLPIALTRLAVPFILLALVPLIAGRQATGIELTVPSADDVSWTHDIAATLLRFLKNLASLARMSHREGGEQ